LTPRLLVGSADHVPDRDPASCSGTLHLGEVDPEFLGLLLGRLRGVRLLLVVPSAGGLLSRLLSLLGRTPGGVLRLARYLPGLVRRLPGRFLGLTCCLTGGVLRLLGYTPGSLLGLPRNLAYLIGDPAQGSAALLLALLTPAGQATNGVLHLLGCSTCGFLRLAGYLARLVGHLACGLLCLSGYLTGSVLRLLGRPLRDLLHLLVGLLGGLVHLVFHSSILGGPLHRAFDLRVVVDHLLDQGLGVARGGLLGVPLKLLVVVLDLAPHTAYRLPEEALGLLQVLILLRLLLGVLRLFAHFVSFSVAHH
jgi:hypothetical protein